MTIKIGMIGLDTSHVSIFAKLLHDPSHPYHIPGGRVVAGYPGGSPDFPLSIDRVGKYTEELASYGTEIVDTPEEAAQKSDAVLLLAVDGRVHLDLFRRIAPFAKLVFIDKPFAVTSADAQAIAAIAREQGVALMSASSLRFAEKLTEALDNPEGGDIFGADGFGPLPFQETQPGLFWYGIHTVDMLYRVLGTGCVQVQAVTNERHDFVTGLWADGRIGTVRGNRCDGNRFGITIHRPKGSQFVDASGSDKPYYACLLERIMEMFRTGVPQAAIEDTLEVIRFIEAANRSRELGRAVRLDEI